MIPLYDDQPIRSSPVITIALILANLIVFAGWQLVVGLEQSVEMAAMVPEKISMQRPQEAIYIFTSMFMHGGWLHLLGNMWFLWIFGNNIEDACGHIRFLILYVLCGVVAALAHVIAQPESTVPLVGASGAVSGVLGAYLLIHPHARIRTLIPIAFFIRIVDIPAFVFLILWIGLQVLSQMFTRLPEGSAGIAYLAHIGGFIAGAVLINVFRRRYDHRLSGGSTWVRTKSHERSWD